MKHVRQEFVEKRRKGGGYHSNQGDEYRGCKARGGGSNLSQEAKDREGVIIIGTEWWGWCADMQYGRYRSRRKG